MLFREPEPLAAPADFEIRHAFETALSILGSGPILSKRSAVTWADEPKTGNRVPCLCIVAAITAASRTSQIRDAVMRYTRQALPGRIMAYDNQWRPIGELIPSSIEAYNDATGTTLEHAKELLRKAKSYVGVVAA